jgi:predicted nucleic acid-binding Zn ribbon protein
MQKMSDPELSDCPACGQPQLKKLISAVAFRLKGSGWYETDFKKGSQKNVAKDDAPPKESTPAVACDGTGGCGARPAPTAT